MGGAGWRWVEVEGLGGVGRGGRAGWRWEGLGEGG